MLRNSNIQIGIVTIKNIVTICHYNYCNDEYYNNIVIYYYNNIRIYRNSKPNHIAE